MLTDDAITAPLALRPMDAGDVAAAVAISAAAFGIDSRQESILLRWGRRIEHLLRTDPDGAFAAELDGRVVAVAQALRREHVWCLSLLAVAPDAQSAGAGRGLLDRTLSYGARTEPGLIIGSNDPRALRIYGLSGFSLRPTFEAAGSIDRSRLPRPHPRIREAGLNDLESLAAISRDLRGAPHTEDLEFALALGVRLWRLGDSGFAAAMPGHGLWLLAARDEDTATALLWQALELAGETEPAIRWITGEQDWAINVALQAGLGLTAYGALGVRGHPGPLRPYIPSGPFG